MFATLKGALLGPLLGHWRRANQYHRKSQAAFNRAAKSSSSDICEFLSTAPTRLTVPLILISQVSRSGGTLLSQLFDGHPQIAAHPHELGFGFPSEESWIARATTAQETLARMAEHAHFQFTRSGFSKGEQQADRFPFLFSAAAQNAVFTKLWQSAPPKNDRDCADIYFSSYFQAWLNYHQSLAETRYVTAFQPRFANRTEKVDAFFAAYPDGYLLQVLRDPWTWYASAQKNQRWIKKRSTPEGILKEWIGSTEAILRNVSAYPHRVIVVHFDSLLNSTEQTMRDLCRILNLDFLPSMLKPTFNGNLMTANSSYAVPRAGIIEAPSDRAKQLIRSQKEMIDVRCEELYESALSKVDCCA